MASSVDDVQGSFRDSTFESYTQVLEVRILESLTRTLKEELKAARSDFHPTIGRCSHCPVVAKTPSVRVNRRHAHGPLKSPVELSMQNGSFVHDEPCTAEHEGGAPAELRPDLRVSGVIAHLADQLQDAAEVGDLLKRGICSVLVHAEV